MSTQARDDYKTAVKNMAEAVVDDYRSLPPKERTDEKLDQLTHEAVWNDSQVTDDDNARATLMYSDNACYALWSGVYRGEDRKVSDNFPWAKFAAPAFKRDVFLKAAELLGKKK
jgi:hypothetical protein